MRATTFLPLASAASVTPPLPVQTFSPFVSVGPVNDRKPTCVLLVVSTNVTVTAFGRTSGTAIGADGLVCWRLFSWTRARALIAVTLRASPQKPPKKSGRFDSVALTSKTYGDAQGPPLTLAAGIGLTSEVPS